LSLIFSSKVKERPSNRRIKNVQKRLQSLSKELIKELKGNPVFRKQEMSRILRNKMVDNSKSEDEKNLLDSVMKIIDDEQSEDVEHGINALKFVADHCVRYDVNNPDLKSFVSLYILKVII